MTGDELTATAEANGWDVYQLAELFEYTWDELSPSDKTVTGIIDKALVDGEDADWIREVVEHPPK
jgi:hypothetical protein